ncbi:MAG: sigma factor-like helix-turn-helix DNA-binding protein, partial [Bacteroidota bacterium]
RSHLLKAVETLAEPYRSIVILREIQELRYQEICEALDLPLSTVKVYLHRARKTLRTQLQEVLQRENG